MITKLGAALKFCSCHNLDKESTMDVPSRILERTKSDNLLAPMVLILMKSNPFWLKRKKIFTKLLAWEFSSSLTKMLYLKMLVITQTLFSIQVYSLKKKVPRKAALLQIKRSECIFIISYINLISFFFYIK